jgi:hypothetical protein
MVAIAPEKSMNAKTRSIPIRPDLDLDRRIMEMKIVMRTRKARKETESPILDPEGK